MTDSLELPERVLVVTAHPDDVDFGAAGTVARWTAAGVPVSYCIITDGAAGSQDPTIALDELAEVRQDEQRKAAAEVGVSELHFLGYPDGRLTVDLALRRDLSRVIRIVRPSVLLTQSPERNWSRIRASHPDHLAAGEAALQAVYPDARNPYAHPELLDEGLEPHAVGQVWLMAAPDASTAVDITDTIEHKVAALHCHRSQLSAPEELDAMIRNWAKATAEANGLGSGRLAEAFQVVATA